MFRQISKLLDFLGQISFLKRLTFTVLFNLILLSLWYLILYKPLIQKIATIKAEIDLTKNQHTENVLNKDFLLNLKDELTKKVEFLIFCNINKRISYIIELLENFELSLLSCNPSKKIKEDTFIKALYNFKFKGDYFRINHFLEKLSLSNLYIECKNFKLKNSDSGILECDLLLFFITVSDKVIS